MLLKFRKPTRNNRAQSLVLFAALFVLLAGLVVGAMQLIGLLGGGRQLQNATDSGNLSIAQAAPNKIGIGLQSGTEQDNFAAFTNNSGQIDLAHYNGVVGQCIWVALNAEAENTDTARSNCQTVVASAEGASDGIGQRLLTQLDTAGQTDQFFTTLANSNPIGLLGDSSVHPDDSSYNVAFMNSNGLSNVSLDPSNAPPQSNGKPISLPSNLLSSTTSSTGYPYVSGYNAVNFNLNQLSVTLSGVSVQPNQRPHLVGNPDFNGQTQQPISSLSLPPNSFQSAATATDAHKGGSEVGGGGKGPWKLGTSSSPTLKMTSSAIVGLLNQDIPASVPHGFIIVTNGGGDSDNSPLPSNESIFNNQLFTGIFVANNGCFSTDESLIQAWADYNNNGQSGNQPPTDGLFNVDGTPVSGQQFKITALGGNGYPMMCDYTNVQGPNAIAAAAALLPAFMNAYPAPLSGSGSGCVLTAVEKLKAEVMELYTSGQGGTPAQVATTGMRYFNHTSTYVAGAGQSPEFTRPGNIVELCNQAANVQNGTAVDNKNSIMVQLKQRMKEIKPSATDAEMNELLTGNTLDLSTTFYIWMDDTNTFRLTQTAPSWKNGSVNTSASPDGTPQPMGVNYPTIGLSVDPIGECGFNQSLFAVQPDPATDYLGVDTATWTPSTGTSNLLGTLNFSESISGTAVVIGPPTPPPPSCSGPWIQAVQNYVATAEFYDPNYIANIYSLGQGHVTSISETNQDWQTYSNGCTVSPALWNAWNNSGNWIYQWLAAMYPPGSYCGAVMTITVTFDNSSSCGDSHTFQVPN